jgi:hypothetical protein
MAGTFKEGWYLSGAVSSVSMDLATTDEFGVRYSSDVSATGFQVGGGYRWLWTSFNMELGALYSSYSFDDTITLKASDGSTEEEDLPNVAGFGIEWNIGWTF